MSKNNYSGITPEFGEVVRSIIDSVLLDLNVCLPAKIVSYDKDTQYADVEIQLQQKFGDGSLVSYAVIPKVPVKHPRSNAGHAFIHMPIKPGDDVVLVFSQRSLDNWKTQGGMTDPGDPRKHHITDAYALIGGSAIPDAFAPETEDAIEIVNFESKTNIFPDGKYQIKGGIGDDLVFVLYDLILGIQRSFTETLIGPQFLEDPLDPGWVIIQQRASAFTKGNDPYGGV